MFHVDLTVFAFVSITMIARVPDVAADTPLTFRRIPGLSVSPKNDYETHVAVHNVQAAVSAGNANNEDLRAAWLLYDKVGDAPKSCDSYSKYQMHREME